MFNEYGLSGNFEWKSSLEGGLSSKIQQDWPLLEVVSQVLYYLSLW